MKPRWIAAGALAAVLLLLALLAGPFDEGGDAPLLDRPGAEDPRTPALRGRAEAVAAEEVEAEAKGPVPAPAHVYGDPWTARVVVIGIDQKPIANVPLRVDASDESVRTDDEGRASIQTRLPRLRFRTGPGWLLDHPVEQTPYEPEATLQVVEILPFRIQVLDGAGRPAAGVHGGVEHWYLTANHASGGQTMSHDTTSFGPTDADGRCTLSLAASSEGLTVYAAKEGDCAKEEVAFPFVREVVLRLRPRLRLTARIYDASGRHVPLEGVVVARPADPTRTTHRSPYFMIDFDEDLVETDGNGPPEKLSLFVSGVGPWWVHVEPSFGKRAPSTPILVRAPAADLKLVCPPAVHLFGRVLDKPDAAYAVHWLPDPDAAGRKRFPKEGRVQDDGQFYVVGIAPGPGRLYIHSRDDDRYALVEGLTAPQEGFEVRLVGSTPLSGRIVDLARREGATHGASQVKAESGDVWATADVAEDGSFRIRGLPPGRYDLHGRRHGPWGSGGTRWKPFPDGQGFAPADSPIELAAPR